MKAIAALTLLLSVALPLAGAGVRGDFDGDGKADLLFTANWPCNQVGEWRMDGFTIAQASFVTSYSSEWSLQVTGDFNGDSRTDILLYREADSAIVIWLMNGTTIAKAGLVAWAGTGWRPIVTGDVNGDSTDDVIWRHTNGVLAVWQMNGLSLLAAAYLTNPGLDWEVVDTGDFNGDGKSDLLLQHVLDTVAVWLLDGSTIVATQVFNPGPHWRAVAAGDFDGDNDADIILQHAAGGQVGQWLMNGTTISSAAVIADVGISFTYSRRPYLNWILLAARDYNGDGRADLLLLEGIEQFLGNGYVAEWQMDGAQISAGYVIGQFQLSWEPLFK